MYFCFLVYDIWTGNGHFAWDMDLRGINVFPN